MDNNKIWELVTNQLLPTEANTVWQQISLSPKLLAQYKKMKRAWSLSNSQQVLSDKAVDASYKQFRMNYMNKSNTTRWIQLAKYAAILIISLSVSYLFWTTQTSLQPESVMVSHFTSGNGSVNSIQLSDGSEIFLNANSSLDIYKADSENVEVKLNGEALFNIVHNEKRRFVVNANNLQIEDLGTRFNVRSFEEDQQVIATLIEGEIEISNTNRQFVERLLPGQQMQYSTVNGQYSIANVDTTYVGSWKESKFEFVNKSLEEIAKDLENWYGVHISFKCEKIAQERFTGVIQKSADIDKVLEVIAYSAGIKYSINKTNNQTVIMIQ